MIPSLRRRKIAQLRPHHDPNWCDALESALWREAWRQRGWRQDRYVRMNQQQVDATFWSFRMALLGVPQGALPVALSGEAE